MKSPPSLNRPNPWARNNGNKTHCLRGHEFSAENTYFNTRGERQCRKCMALRQSKKWQPVRTGKYDDCGNAKLTADQVREIHSRYQSGERYRSLAKAFGVTYSAVEKIIRGARWPNIHKEFHPGDFEVATPARPGAFSNRSLLKQAAASV